MKTNIAVGTPIVTTGDYEGGGLSPHQLAKLATSKLISVSDTAHPAIRDQAHAFKNRMEMVLLQYFEKMAESERTRIAHKLKAGGHVEIAGAIMRI